MRIGISRCHQRCLARSSYAISPARHAALNTNDSLLGITRRGAPAMEPARC
jgi:hypothetical protein